MPLAQKLFSRFSQLIDVATTRAEAIWKRCNADGTVSDRTAAETRSDLGAGTLSTIPTGNLVWVDAVYGNDATGTRGRSDLPFLTISAAITTATSGDSVSIRTGTYDERVVLKNGVDLQFDAGSGIIYTGPSAGAAIGDGGVAATATITGGYFENSSTSSGSAPTILCSNASSVLRFIGIEEARNSNSTGSSNAAIALSAGSLSVYGVAAVSEAYDAILVEGGVLAASFVGIDGADNAIEVNGGTADVSFQSSESGAEVFLVNSGTLTVRGTVAAGSNAVTNAGGVLILEVLDVVVSNDVSLSHNGGTTDVINSRLRTTNTNSESVVVQSPGLTLKNGVILAAHSGAVNSITASSAQTVYVTGTLSINRPIDADVTLDYTGMKLGGDGSAITGLPNASITMATARLLGRTTAGTGAAEAISVGNGITLSSATLGLGDIAPSSVNGLTITAGNASVFNAGDDSNVTMDDDAALTVHGSVDLTGDGSLVITSGTLASMAFQAATAVNIDGGTIDGTVIGGVSAAAVTASVLSFASFQANLYVSEIGILQITDPSGGGSRYGRINLFNIVKTRAQNIDGDEDFEVLTNLRVDGNNTVTGTTTLTGGAIMGAPMRLKAYTVATLPAGTAGDTAFVTDALLPSFLTTIAGGGSVVSPVFFNGSGWVSF